VVLAAAGAGAFLWKIRRIPPVTGTAKAAFLCSLVWLLYVGLFDPFSVVPYPNVYFIVSFILGLPELAVMYRGHRSKFAAAMQVLFALAGILCVLTYLFGFYHAVKERKGASSYLPASARPPSLFRPRFVAVVESDISIGYPSGPGQDQRGDGAQI
jgi:hypothetical protein